MKAHEIVLASIALLVAPAAFADHVFQFRGPVTACVSNSSDCEPTEEIFLELRLDSGTYVLGTDINEADTNEPRALRSFNYFIEMNYPPYPPTSTAKHVIWGSTFASTGFNTPDFALRTVGLPAYVGGSSSLTAVDFSVTSSSLPNRTISLAFVVKDGAWSLQFADMDAKKIEYTRYNGRGGRWTLISSQ